MAEVLPPMMREMTIVPENLQAGQVAKAVEGMLNKKIGEGGMGVVHLAEAPDGRRVALKVLRPPTKP